LPEYLPRVQIELRPPEVQHAGLDAFMGVGEEVREVLERRPASMVVVRIVRPKFIRRAASSGERATSPRRPTRSS
jgi:transposase